MCLGCWVDADAPTSIGTDYREWAALVDELYAIDGAGGPLHVVLDDWNTETGLLVPWPRPWINLNDYTDHVFVICARIVTIMRWWREDQRIAALALYWYGPVTTGIPWTRHGQPAKPLTVEFA